jgi:hypothetical protein
MAMNAALNFARLVGVGIAVSGCLSLFAACQSATGVPNEGSGGAVKATGGEDSTSGGAHAGGSPGFSVGGADQTSNGGTLLVGGSPDFSGGAAPFGGEGGALPMGGFGGVPEGGQCPEQLPSGECEPPDSFACDGYIFPFVSVLCTCVAPEGGGDAEWSCAL